MNPTAIGALIWMASAPLFLVLWLISRRKFKKLTTDSLQAAELHQAALARGGAEHEATKAKYSAIISQEVAKTRSEHWKLSSASISTSVRAPSSAGSIT